MKKGNTWEGEVKLRLHFELSTLALVCEGEDESVWEFSGHLSFAIGEGGDEELKGRLVWAHEDAYWYVESLFVRRKEWAKRREEWVSEGVGLYWEALNHAVLDGLGEPPSHLELLAESHLYDMEEGR